MANKYGLDFKHMKGYGMKIMLKDLEYSNLKILFMKDNGIKTTLMEMENLPVIMCNT